MDRENRLKPPMVQHLEEKRDEAGLKTSWPTADGYWHYGIEKRGKLEKALVVGHNDLAEVECKIWILDSDLYADFMAKEEKSEAERGGEMFFGTQMMEVENAEETLKLAARGKAKGSGKGGERGERKGKGERGSKSESE